MYQALISFSGTSKLQIGAISNFDNRLHDIIPSLGREVVLILVVFNPLLTTSAYAPENFRGP